MTTSPTLGSLLRATRARLGITLKEMSVRTGIPFSTLSKVEHDRLSLTYDKLVTISERLGVPLAELLADGRSAERGPVLGRKSIGTVNTSLAIETPNYDYYYLSPELRDKRMIPIVSRIKARSLAEFGELIRHPGEEFIYVLEGEVEVHSEYYEPFRLTTGQSVYIDSGMGHAYIAVGSTSASVLCVCSSSQEELLAAARAARPQNDSPPSERILPPTPARRSTGAARQAKPARQRRS